MKNKELEQYLNSLGTGIEAVFEKLKTINEAFKEVNEEIRGEKNTKVKTWDELKFDKGYYVERDSEIAYLDDLIKHSFHKNIVPTEKHAKSILAFCQLSMLMDDLGDECKVDWSNTTKIKYIIIQERDSVFKSKTFNYGQFLAFKTKSIRDKFLAKNEGLIKDYFML